MALNNVIQFPDTGRNSAARADRAPILKASSDYLARKLRAALRAMLPEIDEDLLTRGDLADEREQRQLYYGAHDVLQQNAARLESLIAAHWLRLLAEAGRRSAKPKTLELAGDLDELQLVDYVDVDEDLAVRAIASRLRDGCEDGLFGAGRRFAFLSGCAEDELPIADLLAKAVQASVTEAGFAPQARLEVLRALGRHGVGYLAAAVQDANAYLVEQNVLPQLRRSYVRPEAGKRPGGEALAATVGGDVFALLQHLVGAAGTGAAAPTASGVPVASARLAVPEAGVSLASMALAMEAVMTSLNVLQRSMPMAADAAPSNVLREFRNSDAGRSLGHIDAITADIVATLFDFIFDDAAIADPIKALIGRMQIPVLKVAMLDKSFFSSKAHPARRLLDGISRAAVRCGPGVGRDDPLYTRVAGIIDHLLNDFNQDTSLFDRLCGELDAFLDSQEALADEHAARAAPLVAAEERRQIAAQVADQALAGWLAMPLPAVVGDLLAHEWRGLLANHYRAGDHAAWSAALGTMADLVASVQPQRDARARRLLAAKLPMLVKRVQDALNQARVPDERRLALIDGLFDLHAAVLRGAAPEVAPAPPPRAAAEAEIDSAVIEQGDIRVDNISLLDSGAPPVGDVDHEVASEVAEIKRGDWVEFLEGEAGFVRYRLSWVSPQGGILLFTNPHSPRALAVAPAALAVQLRRGDAAVVPAEPIFERAVNRALESLQAA